MLPFRLLPVLLLAIFFPGCATDAEVVALQWSIVEVPCVGSYAMVEMPDPEPVSVQVRYAENGVVAYVQDIAFTDGLAQVYCNDDITLTYAQVIE